MAGKSRETMNISDIAAALGVSKTTVSRAISGKGRIGEKTRTRVVNYINEHNFRPSILAQGLANNRTYNIALVISKRFSGLDLPFLRKSMRAVYENATQRGYDVLLVFASERDARPVQRVLENRKVDGVILTRSIENDPCLPLLEKYNIPFVVMGYEKNNVLQVDNDQVGGCCELTTLLLLKGMTRIALLGGSNQFMVNERRCQGFVRAYEHAGVELDKRMIITELESDIQRLGGLEAALDGHPDCILCMDDALALFVMKQLHQRGVRVPQDVRVASLYDSEALAEHTPSVTALRFDAAELAQAACNLLLNCLDGKQVPDSIELGYQVMLRDSTK